mgnify:CR=1 FL=1
MLLGLFLIIVFVKISYAEFDLQIPLDTIVGLSFEQTTYEKLINISPGESIYLISVLSQEYPPCQLKKVEVKEIETGFGLSYGETINLSGYEEIEDEHFELILPNNKKRVLTIKYGSCGYREISVSNNEVKQKIIEDNNNLSEIVSVNSDTVRETNIINIPNYSQEDKKLVGNIVNTSGTIEYENVSNYSEHLESDSKNEKNLFESIIEKIVNFFKSIFK